MIHYSKTKEKIMKQVTNNFNQDYLPETWMKFEDNMQNNETGH